jgi:hypothetical protein
VPDYLSQRQNVLTQDPAGKEELNSHLETVADRFGLRWLEQGDRNPVQSLWQAKHALATNELLTLGYAIRNLAKANLKWTLHQVNQMKIGSDGECAGAAFELLGLNLFAGAGQRIAPAPANSPGYDGSVFFDDGSSLMVSIKNHGASVHERAFLSEAAMIRSDFIQAARAGGATARVMRIAANRRPLAAEWKLLRRQIKDMFSTGKVEDSPVWSGQVAPMPAEWNPLSSRHLSDVFILAAPFHPNEQKNFEDNIRKGVANMEKHCATVGPHVCRTLFLRMSATASMPDCVKWTNAYFSQFPDTKVELILLYQAANAVDLNTNGVAISHCILRVQGPNFGRQTAGRSSAKFEIFPLVGIVHSKPTRQILSDGVNTKPFDGHYVFQRGDIYHQHDASPGPRTFVLRNPAPGIFHHAVVGDTVFSMRGSEDGRLLLLP